MKISLIHGICIRYDAISNAIADQVLWLRGAGHEVVLYAYACDRPELHCHLVSTLPDVIYDAHFQASELVIFHFGIYYQLFDLIPVAPRGARRLVCFHNITPKPFVAEAEHATIDRSFRQMANIAFADHVICDSATNLDVLRAARMDTRATVLPLSVSTAPAAMTSKPSAVDAVIRVAFVGRLVKSKGPADLLAALNGIAQRDAHGPRLEVDIVGSLVFSDPALVAAVREAAQSLPERYDRRVTLRLHGDATEEEKRRILAEADLFVLPTRHEGFCVPIVEALGSGCRVITYDNSNTPAISGGFARLVPTGDVSALAQAIADELAMVASPQWRGGGFNIYAQDAWRYAQQFAPETVRMQFLTVVDLGGVHRAHNFLTLP